jgi:hypothetical protein
MDLVEQAMTTYEGFKAGALVCFCIALAALVYELHLLVSQTTSVLENIGTAAATVQTQASDLGPTLRSLQSIGPQATATLKALQTTTTSVGKQVTVTLDAVNRPCNTFTELPTKAADEGARVSKPCGTLADVNRTLATVRGTFGQIEIAANHEDRNLGTLDTQEAQLYTDFHATTVNLNNLLGSPDITRFLKSSADTSTQFALMATEGTAIAKDVHKEADALTAPQPWYKKLYVYGNTGVNIACLVTHSCPF